MGERHGCLGEDSVRTLLSSKQLGKRNYPIISYVYEDIDMNLLLYNIVNVHACEYM